MHWIIQGNVFSEDGWDTLIEALDRQGCSYSIHRCVPFTRALQPEPPALTGSVVVMGTYSLVLAAKERKWLPGAWSDENFDYSVQLKHWGEAMFNHDALLCDFGDVPFQKEPFFLRPIFDSKAFTGLVTDWEDYTGWLEMVRKLTPEDGSTLDLSTPVMVSSVKRIAREFRTWIVDGKVVAASQYKLGRHKTYQPHVDQYIKDFAQKQADIWSPAPCFCLDVFEDQQGQAWIGEVNTLNCSGFYAADMNAVVGAIETMVDKMDASKVITDPSDCKCGLPGQERHGCPYAEDIHDDFETKCNCCGSCEQECCDDI